MKLIYRLVSLDKDNYVLDVYVLQECSSFYFYLFIYLFWWLELEVFIDATNTLLLMP
jgi:hypothetical protein